jgi:transcriptional regulator with XRE-family HTH domain
MLCEMGRHAEVIRANRLKRGWSQQQLADKAGIDQPVINRHETGKSVPSGRLLVRYATAFDIPFTVLERECEETSGAGPTVPASRTGECGDESGELRAGWVREIVEYSSQIPLQGVWNVLQVAAAEWRKHVEFMAAMDSGANGGARGGSQRRRLGTILKKESKPAEQKR